MAASDVVTDSQAPSANAHSAPPRTTRAAVRWCVDGRGVSADRWPLRRGEHVVCAERGAERVEARIEVD